MQVGREETIAGVRLMKVRDFAQWHPYTFVSFRASLWMPDDYLRSIEPLIAIVLDRVCGSDPPPPTRYRCPPWAFPP
jgi:hypothetical protein